MVLADKECPHLFFFGVTGYISAEYSIWWDLALGHLFPAGLPDGTRGGVVLSAPRMVTALQGNLRAAGLPGNFTLHSFRSSGLLSKSVAGTPLVEIMQIGGWKTAILTRTKPKLQVVSTNEA